jgi:hypothetical protein
LESYHPYLLPQEVSKTPTTLGTYGSLPKIRKGRFGSLRPLGVKKRNFQLVPNHGLTYREKNLQDAEIWLEDKSHRERSPFIEQFFLVDMDKGN